MKDIEQDYFDWMINKISNQRYSAYRTHNKILNYLYSIEFTYTLPLDANRFEDGIYLRYRFGYERHIPESVIGSELDVRGCTILEMMIALALRCEDNIMSNTNYGSRTPEWFWDMMKSLGLYEMTDDEYDKQVANKIINRFLNRDYGRDGRGGLFTIEGAKRDLRYVEIWSQAMWYLDQFDN